MKKIILGVVIGLAAILIYNYFHSRKTAEQSLTDASELIQKEIKNVSKLVVSEGTYAKIYNYKNTESYLFNTLAAYKKALIVVNAKATVTYDLHQLKYELKPSEKTVEITFIPEPELQINPDIQFYDVTQDYLNQFKADDYNGIKKKIKADLRKKIEASVLMENAENRLVSELQKLFVLTHSMGWKLQYNGKNVDEQQDFEQLNFKD